MSEPSNKRVRERMPLHLRGHGHVLPDGGRFSFRAVEFSNLGMKIEATGAVPELGAVLLLTFEADYLGEQRRNLNVTAEVRRVEEHSHGALVGLRIDESRSAASLAALDDLYMERFMEEELEETLFAGD